MDSNSEPILSLDPKVTDVTSVVLFYQKATKLHFEIQKIKDINESRARWMEMKAVWLDCFQKLIRAADSNNPDIWCALGDVFANGRGTERNLEESLKWYQRAAEAGHTTAMIRLALHLRRPGERQDVTSALQWFRKAADAGDADGMLWLGYSYRDGDCCTHDLEQALQWFLKAAEAGVKNAILNVARLYASTDCRASPTEAIKWYLKAAEAGIYYSYLELAGLYDDHAAVTYDPVEAIKWYQKAAEYNDGYSAQLAMLELAKHYRNGIGTPCDREMAKQWLLRLVKIKTENRTLQNKAAKILRKMEEELL